MTASAPLPDDALNEPSDNQPVNSALISPRSDAGDGRPPACRRRASSIVSFSSATSPDSSPKRGPGREIANAIRTDRAAFFGRIKKGNGVSAIRCPQLAAAALALSYLLQDDDDRDGSISPLESPQGEKHRAVTVEDIFRALSLPLSYGTNSDVTLHELGEIVARFVRVDPRFADVSVGVVVLDQLRLDSDVETADIANGATPKQVAVSMSEFRTEIQSDSTRRAQIRLLFYDSELVEQSLTIVEEDTESDDAEAMTKMMLSSFVSPSIRVQKRNATSVQAPKIKMACGIAVDVLPQQTLIDVATVSLGPDLEPFLNRVEAPLTAVYRAMTTRSAVGRAQGFLTLKKPSAAKVTSPQLSATRSLTQGSCMYNPMLLSGYGHGCSVTPLTEIGCSFSPHIVALGLAINVLRGVSDNGEGESVCGVDLNSIVDVLRLPIDFLCGAPLRIDQVFSYYSRFIEAARLPFFADLVPILQTVRRQGAATSLSVGDLSGLFTQVVLENGKNNSQPRVVVLCCFDPNLVHSTANILSKGPHWALLTAYNPDEQFATLHDVFPVKYGVSWSVPLQTLHHAMTGNGFIVMCLDCVDVNLITPPVTNETVRQFVANTRKHVSIFGVTAPSVLFPTVQCPLSVAAVALSRLGLQTSICDIVAKAPCSVAALFDVDITMNDFCRCINWFVHGKDDIVALCEHIRDERKGGMSAISFMARARDSIEKRTEQLIVHFTRGMVVNAPPCDVRHGDYALIVGVDGNDITLLDPNPEACHRVWAAGAVELLQAMQDVCLRSRRPRGLIAITHDPNKSKLFQHITVDMFKLSCHPFRPAPLPHFKGFAMALTSLGHPVSAEDVYYRGATALRSKVLTPETPGIKEAAEQDAPQEQEERVGAASDAMILILPKPPLGAGKKQGLSLSTARSLITVDALLGHIDAFLTMVPPSFKISVDAFEVTELADFRSLLETYKLAVEADRDKSTLKKRLLFVYNVRAMHGASFDYSACGVMAAFDGDTETVTVAEAEPASWGALWCASVSDIFKGLCNGGSDDGEAQFGVITVIAADEPGKNKKITEPDPHLPHE